MDSRRSRGRQILAIAALVSLIGITGCGVLRFQNAIGVSKMEALHRLGPPTQVISDVEGGEVWVYPMGRETVATYESDHRSGKPGDSFADGLSTALANGIVDGIFDPRGPYRYLYIDGSGRVTGWETKSSLRRLF